MGIREKLATIQQNLNAPKGNYNSFGKYKYRSCEDILEAVKPLLKETGTVLTINDDLVLIGDRYYLKAMAILCDIETSESIANCAFARETESKSGMDAAQITGSASSYARKYALNGLFCIDDVADPDTRDNRTESETKSQYIDDIKVRSIVDRANNDGVDTDKLCKLYKVSKLEHITEKMFYNINQNWEKIKERCGA